MAAAATAGAPERASMSSKSDEDFPPGAEIRLPSPPYRSDDDGCLPPPLRSFPPLPSPPHVSDTDGSGSGWEGSRRGRHSKNTTISGVTNEARRVLDTFLKRTLLDSLGGSGDPSLIHEALQLPDPRTRRHQTSRQDQILIEKLERKLQQLQNLSQCDEPEDHYVPLYPHLPPAAGAPMSHHSATGDGEPSKLGHTTAPPRYFPPSAPPVVPDDNTSSSGGHKTPSPPQAIYGTGSQKSNSPPQLIYSNRGELQTAARLSGEPPQYDFTSRERRYTEGDSLDMVDSCLPTPRQARKVAHGGDLEAGDESVSSSSTEDYELCDPNELLNRKKKSFFRRATERLMHSFRRRKELQQHQLEAAGEMESPKDDGFSVAVGELMISPSKLKKTSKKGAGFLLPGIDEQHFSDTAMIRQSKSKSPTAGRRSVFGTPKRKAGGGHKTLAKTGSSDTGCSYVPVVVQSEGEDSRTKIKKSPLPWKHKVRVKDDSDKITVGDKQQQQGIFDNFIKGIRKSSLKLKRGKKDHQRSRSADNLTAIRPLTKEHEILLQRYLPAGAAGHHTPVVLPGGRGRRRHRGEMSDGTEESDSQAGGLLPTSHRAAIDPSSLRLPLVPATVTTATDGCGGDKSDGDNSYDEICDMPPGIGRQVSSGEDDLDGMLAYFQRQSSVPFHERSEAEKEQLYEKIAEQLAVIADYYNASLGSPLGAPLGAGPFSAEDMPGIPPSSSSCKDAEDPGKKSSDSDKESSAAARAMHRKRRRRLKALNKLGFSHMEEVEENLAGNLPPPSNVSDPTPIVEELVKNASYSKFQQIVSQNIGDEPGWDQIAMMFRLTQTAVGLAGMGTAAALQIKEITLKYFEDKFAGWIVHQGGWESVVEDTNTENDSELD